MGQPKLLLPIQGESLLHRLLRQLSSLPVHSIWVLIREEDAELANELERFLEIAPPAPGKPPVQAVIPASRSSQMKESVRKLLQAIRCETGTPRAGDRYLLIPADHPVVERRVVDRLLAAAHQAGERIIVPRHGNRRGHPTLFPAGLPEAMTRIPRDAGLNWLLREFPEQVAEVECPEPSVLWDLDTPEDYAACVAQLQAGE